MWKREAPERPASDASRPTVQLLIALMAAVLVAVVAVSWASRSSAESWRESVDERLLDGGAGANAAAVLLEQKHLEAYRAMAFTQGFAQELDELDVAGIRSLISPVDANLSVPMTDILDEQGRVVFAFRAEEAVKPLYRHRNDLATVRRVLGGEADDRGDRYTELVTTDEGPLIATTGPVRLGDRIVGAVLVMTPLEQLLDTATNSSGVPLTAYSLERGDPMATTGPARPRTLASELRTRLTTTPEALPHEDAWEVMDRPYREQIGALVLRGKTAAFLGAALPDRADAVARNVIVASVVAALAICLALFLVFTSWRTRPRRTHDAEARPLLSLPSGASPGDRR